MESIIRKTIILIAAIVFFYQPGRCFADAVCGDGKVTDSEECDGFSTKSGFPLGSNQKCSQDCKSVDTCGDGKVTGDEECDDGNKVDGDGCDSHCKSECGNGQINTGEECDDGNTVSGDGCDSHCKKEECGNGVLEGSEMCDGNSNPFNGQGYCDNSCIYHPSKSTLLTCYYDKVKNVCYQEKGQCLKAQDSKICANQFFACLQKSEKECKEIPIFFFSACGDGKIEDGEQCDEGAKNGTPGSKCNATCDYIIDQTNYHCFYDNYYNNGNSGMSKCMAQDIACKKQGGNTDCPGAFHQCLVDEDKACSLSQAEANGDGSGSPSSPIMGCSFIPGTETSGSVGPWLVFAFGLIPMAGRRWKKGNR